jgi:hypothetical protein
MHNVKNSHQKNGESLLIAEIKDNHLINTIKLICSKIKIIGTMLDAMPPKSAYFKAKQNKQG